MDGNTGSYCVSHHASLILKKLNAQRLNGDKTCDIQLKCDGKIFPAHKSILSNVSDYFEKLFYTEMQEKYQAEIEIKATNSVTLQKILDYTYSGEINLTTETIFELLNAAHYFLIKELLDFCCDFLLKTLTSENAIGLWKIAKRLDLDNLRTPAQNLITENYSELTDFEEIYSMDLTSIKALLAAKPEDSNGEKAAFQFTVAWVKHDLEERKHLFPQLFKLIDLYEIGHEFLAYFVATEDLVTEFLECLQEVAKQLKHIYGPREKHSISIMNKDSTTITILDVASAVEKVATLSQPREDASFVMYNTYLYMIGGLIDGRLSNSVMKSDVSHPKKCWENQPSMSRRRRKAGVVILDDSMFVFGGYVDDKLWLVPECCGLEENKICSKWEDMEMCRVTSCDLTSYKGRLYALEYRGLTCEKYDPCAEKSTMMRKLPVACVKLLVMEDQFYALCKDRGFNLVLKTYNPESGKSEVVSETGNVESFRDACAAHGEIVVAVTGRLSNEDSDDKGDLAPLSDESDNNSKSCESETVVYIKAYNFADEKWRIVTASYELSDYWKFVPYYSSKKYILARPNVF